MTIEEMIDRFLVLYVAKTEHGSARMVLSTIVELAEVRAQRKLAEDLIAGRAS